MSVLPVQGPWAGQALGVFPPFLTPCLCSWGREGQWGCQCGPGADVRQQALAAHAAWASLVGRAQLAHLVLSNLSHQRVEGILHALGRRGWLSVRLGPGAWQRRGPRDPSVKLMHHPSSPWPLPTPPPHRQPQGSPHQAAWPSGAPPQGSPEVWLPALTSRVPLLSDLPPWSPTAH